MNKEQLKKLLDSSKSKNISIEALTTEDSYKLAITVSSSTFETFFYPSKYKKLYVFFSAVGKKREYPIFHRLTWSQNLNGMCLYIDDPTRVQKNIAPAFYFGSPDINYLNLLCIIIKKFSDIHNITNKDICFISSSNGGFASLWCTMQLKGSTCLAFNPQFNIPLYIKNRKSKYEQIFGIHFKDSKLYNRIYLDNIIHEKESNICIYSNLSSPRDKEHIQYLFKKAEKKFKEGLNIIGNIYYIIGAIPAMDPHLAQPNVYMAKALEHMIKNGSFNIKKNFSFYNDTILGYIQYMKIQYKLEKDILLLEKNKVQQNASSEDHKSERRVKFFDIPASAI